MGLVYVLQACYDEVLDMFVEQFLAVQECLEMCLCDIANRLAWDECVSGEISYVGVAIV